MDSIRFGRALGMGARGAAKAIAMAAEAAAAEKPRASQTGSTPTAPSSEATRLRASAGRTAGQLHQTRSGLARGSKRFGEAIWGPFVKLSGVLWLEVTGVFFGLFLLTALLSIWRLRSSLHDVGTNHAEHQRLIWAIVMSVVFGYFCASSFARAARRERGKN